jgi:hypothetical protein
MIQKAMGASNVDSDFVRATTENATSSGNYGDSSNFKLTNDQLADLEH